MLDTPNRDRKAERREETRREILQAAWALARRDGIGGISLRDLARRVGMRAPSLYTYFDSKHAIYDAMFAEGWRALADAMTVTEREDGGGDPEERLRVRAAAFVRFATEDPVRYQLMQQRPIPDFEPSPQSYAPSLESYERLRATMAEIEIVDQRDLDLWTALLAGLAHQQIANDPGGRRWLQLVDDAVEMFLAHVRGRQEEKGSTR